MAYNTEFGELVRQALGDRTYRWAAGRVGVSQTYIGDMVTSGRVPKRDVVLRFAEACGVPPNPLLLAAGYAPVAENGPEDESTVDGSGPEDFDVRSYRGGEFLTPEEIDAVNRTVRLYLETARRRKGE